MSETNDAERFQRLAMPHMDAAYNLARWLCGDEHEAEDIAQEAMLRAYRFFAGFRGEDMRAWLLRIVRNTYYTEWRRKRSREASAEFDEELHSLAGDDGEAALRATPEAGLLLGEEIRLLDRALAALPVEFREALVLREIEDLSYKQIAAALAVPIGTVMSRIARGRQLLARTFRESNGDTHELRPRQDPARRLR